MNPSLGLLGRCIVLAFALLWFSADSHAQQKATPRVATPSTSSDAKTIRGVLENGLEYYEPHTSPDGSIVAVKHKFPHYAGKHFILAIDVEKRLLKLIPDLNKTTLDNTYAYGQADKYPDTRPGKTGTTATGFKLRSVFGSEEYRTVFFSPAVYMLDVPAGRAVGPGGVGAGTMDLNLYEMETGNTIRTLCTGPTGVLALPARSHKNYTLFHSYNDFSEKDDCIVAGVNEGDTCHRFECSGEVAANMLDDRFIYAHPRLKSAVQYNDLTAFDRRTGKRVATLRFPDAATGQMMYSASDGRVYRYDRTAATLHAYEVRDTSFVETGSTRLSGVALPAKQEWTMAACNGPAVLFLPMNIESAEKGGTAANTATVVSASDGKPIFRISPFYVRTGEVLAQQAATKQAERQKLEAAWKQQAGDRAAKESAAVAEKAARCKEAWGNAQYNRGKTVLWGLFEKTHVILESYDCEKDKYRVWEPRPEGKLSGGAGRYVEISGKEFRAHRGWTDKQWHKCERCDGNGRYEVTETKTRVKDLPWGYFSGIETRSIRTTSTTREQYCNTCDGRGVVLK